MADLKSLIETRDELVDESCILNKEIKDKNDRRKEIDRHLKSIEDEIRNSCLNQAAVFDEKVIVVGQDGILTSYIKSV